jgi:hypothetical protein
MDALPDSGCATSRKPKKTVFQHNFTDGCQKSQNESVWRKEKEKEIGEGIPLPFHELFELRGEAHRCSEMRRFALKISPSTFSIL